MDLMTEDEARTRVRDMLDSRDWWAIPGGSEGSHDLMREIEERFYLGEANADFHLFIVPGSGVLSVAFAHKRRMSVPELAGLMRELCPHVGWSKRQWEDTLKTQDILAAASPDDEYAVVPYLAWHDWVMGDDGWKPAAERR